MANWTTHRWLSASCNSSERCRTRTWSSGWLGPPARLQGSSRTFSTLAVSDQEVELASCGGRQPSGPTPSSAKRAGSYQRDRRSSCNSRFVLQAGSTLTSQRLSKRAALPPLGAVVSCPATRLLHQWQPGSSELPSEIPLCA